MEIELQIPFILQIPRYMRCVQGREYQVQHVSHDRKSFRIFSRVGRVLLSEKLK